MILTAVPLVVEELFTMSVPRIMISPPGYDDVNSVLRRLAGSFADSRQLDNKDMKLLGGSTFLSSTRHLFLNCHQSFEEDWIDADIISAVREFVYNGGTLYASDWAGALVGAAFSELTAFSEKVGAQGIVRAKVSDPYLRQRLTEYVSINFDMPQWIYAERFPASSDVFLWDMNRKPLAIGFRVGRGRVVFTSFHHHAQEAEGRSIAESILTEWLVALPTLHQHLLSTGACMAQYRVTDRHEVVGRIGRERQLIPLNLGLRKGLGVFALSWDHDDRIEFSMRFLRADDVVEAHQESFNPPLVMTVRDPRDGDQVEVRRNVASDSVKDADDQQPYAFAAGTRRDLLGDPDWFASAVIRHLSSLLTGDASLETARQQLTIGRVQDVIATILSGLGYRVEIHKGQANVEGGTEVRAWPQESAGEMPAVEIGTKVTEELVTFQNSDEFDPTGILPSTVFSVRGESISGTERLLVILAFMRGGTRPGRVVTSPAESLSWRPVASESLILGRDQEVISAQEFSNDYHANITVYRAEELSRE